MFYSWQLLRSMLVSVASSLDMRGQSGVGTAFEGRSYAGFAVTYCTVLVFLGFSAPGPVTLTVHLLNPQSASHSFLLGFYLLAPDG